MGFEVPLTENASTGEIDAVSFSRLTKVVRSLAVWALFCSSAGFNAAVADVSPPGGLKYRNVTLRGGLRRGGLKGASKGLEGG